MAKKILKAQVVEPSSLPSAVKGCTERQDMNMGGLTSRFSGGRLSSSYYSMDRKGPLASWIIFSEYQNMFIY